jgi:3-dehydroquinate synthase
MIHQGQGYLIEIESLVNSQFPKLLDEYVNQKKIIVVDENTHDCCLDYLITHFPQLESAEIMLLPAGEENKVLEICYQVWTALLEYKVGRSDLIINLGGGIVTDVGGFIASVYKRGISFVHIPTTLLGMVDASIGGKTGVDLENVKNVIGSFANPKAIFIDPAFLETLPGEEIYNGYAEMLKHALILDPSHWDKIKEILQETDLTTQANISHSIQLKLSIVTQDPNETGLRKLLNFGHTVGHALESYFLGTSPISHGHAVALGIIAESFISFRRGILPEAMYVEIEKTIIRSFPMIVIPENAIEEIIGFAFNDKKNVKNELRFVLLEKIGQAQIDAIFTTAEMGNALLYLTLLAEAKN